MAQFTWTFDAPTGVYKSHAMSKKLREEALEDSVFMDHVESIDGFGRKKGDTITIVRAGDVAEPTSASLVESERIPEDTFSLSTRALTVGEIGRAVPYTSLSEDLSEFNLANPIQKALKEQMRLVLDTAAAVAFRATLLKYAVTGLTTSNVTTNGTFGGPSTANMNVYHCEEISDLLYDTYRVPPVGDSYVAIFRRLGLRGIMRDPDWSEWHKYTDPSAKFNGEVGKIEGIRFIETNHNNALRKVGTSSVLGEGVVFGDDAVAMVEVLSPELRAAVPADFGRSKAVAWYGILTFGLIWETANAGQVKVLHVGST